MVSAHTPEKAALYADTQNWGRTIPEKAAVLEQVLAAWPEDLPKVTLVSLYVDADQEHRWQSVAETLVEQQTGGAFQVLPPEVVTYPVPNYGGLPKENAADIALVLDALDDLLTGRTDYVAVVSNDSDFVALYYKLQDIQERDPDRFRFLHRDDAPFLLVTHGNSGRSPQINNLPDSSRYHIPIAGLLPPDAAPPEPLPPPSAPPPPPPAREPLPTPRPAPVAPSPTPALRRPPAAAASPVLPASARPSITDELPPEEIAGGIASGIGRNHWDEYDNVYVFGYTDVYNVVRGRWQYSREFSYDRAHFSRWFHEEIWPVMERLGGMVGNAYANYPQQYRYRISPQVRGQLRDMDPERRLPIYNQEF